MTKKEYKKKKKRRLRNKKLAKKYPFLIIRNRWTDEVKKREKYDVLEIEPDGDGWMKSFFYLMMDEIKDELIRCNYLYDFRILQYKEKYGSMHLYCGGIPRGCKVQEIIDKYAHLSENICIRCGKPDVGYMAGSWILPICKKCYEKNKYYTRPYEEIVQDEKMADSYTIRRFSPDGTKDTVYDVSDTANILRERWKKKYGSI